jgi:hypothetical protein
MTDGRTLSLGFSPCPNDTFVFHALVHGIVRADGLRWAERLEDVETLNLLAADGALDVTKVSYGAVPSVPREDVSYFKIWYDGAELPPDARVLEAGCGTGGNLYLLQGRGAVSAFDPHPAALDIARSRFPGDRDDFSKWSARRAYGSGELVLTGGVAAVECEPYELVEAGEELEERAVRNRAAEPRVHFRIDRLRVDQPVDEPCRRAVGEPLELSDVEHPAVLQLREDKRMRQLRRPAPRAVGAVEPPLPAVRARERLGAARIGRTQAGDGAQTLALRRRLLQPPRERRERSPARPAGNVAPVEERPHLVPEGARLARAPLVGRRLPHEVEPTRRAGAGGVEEIALAAHGVEKRYRAESPYAA